MELVDVRPVWSMSDSEKLATLDALHDESARRETYRLQLMASLDQSGYANELGAADLPTLLSLRHRLSLAQVRADLKLATTLPKYEVVSAALPTPFDPDHTDDTDDRAKREPGAEAADVETQQAPVWLHLGQAKAIVAALEPVAATGRVPVEDLRVAEEQMVEAARGLDPPGLHRLGKKVRDIVDTDGPEPAEDKAYDQETLQLRKTDHGVTFTGRLANENAELLNTLILENSKPHKTIDGQRDPRSKGKRQSDAFTTVLNAAAGAGTTGHGAIKPHITVTIDYDDLTAALTNATGLLGGSGQGDLLTGQSDDARSRGGRSETGTSGQLDLFAALNERGAPPGFGDLIHGDRLSASAVRRLACDAGILPVVLGSNSRPLDVGIEQRYVTEAMRLALNARDKGCVICGAPPSMCDAHHIVHWAEGGPTSLENLVLMCKHDHRDTHNGYWDVAITDGVVQVTRPQWADPKPSRLRYRPPPAPAPEPGKPPPGTPGSVDATDPGRPGDNPLPPTTTAARPPTPARAWPYTGDIPWITPEEAARLNPWGDEPNQATTSAPTQPRTSTDTGAWTSPWGDEHKNSSPDP
jgi:hypothetical protein